MRAAPRQASRQPPAALPRTTRKTGTRVGIGTVIAGALRQALLGALTSPLKLAGSLFGGGASAATAPATIAFLPGRDLLRPEAEQQLDGLGQLLASRPGLGLRLGAAPASSRTTRYQRSVRPVVSVHTNVGATLSGGKSVPSSG